MMAASGDFQHVTLTIDDVPGAKLPYSLIENHTVVQLKRWLHCRELKTSGNRDDLLKRVKHCIAAGKDKIIPVSVDGGKWYQLKLEKSNINRSACTKKPSPALLPITGWSKFPSVNLPKHFNKGHIHHHIVESVQFISSSVDDVDTDDDDIEDLHTAKPMRKGLQYFKSGHVQNLKDCERNGNYFLKSKVMASYNIDTLYDTTIQVSQDSGFVKDASCTCVASSMGRCNHVCALLYALVDFIERNGNDPKSCTSLLCEWNKGRKKKKNPMRVSDTSYESMKKRKVDDIINYNPTPSYTTRTPEETVNAFLACLEGSTGSSDVRNSQDTMWQSLLYRQYEDYAMSDDIYRNICIKRSVLLQNISVRENKFPQEIVSNQGTGDWFVQRRVRVTASQSKVISAVTKPQSVYNLLERMLWSEPNSLKTKAMLYGTENETNALLDYTKVSQNRTPGYRVTKTGLWVHSRHPEIGCSPDGLVMDPSEGASNLYGLLEIKCPLTLKGKDVKSFEKHLSSKQLSGFCLRKDNNKVELRQNHAYYYQIQTQLGVMGLDWCDLVVWSDVSMLTVRIYFQFKFSWDQQKIPSDNKVQLWIEYIFD